jgi:aromatic-L-amino-acid decarboxylase
LKFVAYYTEFAHSCFHDAFEKNFVYEERKIPADYNKETKTFSINVESVKEQIEKDIKEGFTPFFFGFCIGGTGLGLCDPVEEILPVIKDYKMYTMVDAAWAGVAHFCPEHRQQVEGLRHVNAITVNFAKGGMSGMPGAMYFHDDRHALVESMGGA